jgi:hypothetical protein
VPLRLLREEPPAGPWRAERLTAAAASLMRLAHARGAGHRPAVLAIDGRSSGGKTTLAGRLQGVVAGSAVVHTDDIAWRYSRFGWAELLVNEILIPVRAGRPVLPAAALGTSGSGQQLRRRPAARRRSGDHRFDELEGLVEQAGILGSQGERFDAVSQPAGEQRQVAGCPRGQPQPDSQVRQRAGLLWTVFG